MNTSVAISSAVRVGRARGHPNHATMPHGSPSRANTDWPRAAPAPEPPKRGPGRPAYEPTKKDAAWVRALTAGGVRQERIAASLSIAGTTLRRHYADAIRLGLAEVDALSVQVLVTAMRAGGPPAVAAAIWWMKSRMNWRERRAADDNRTAYSTLRIIIELVG